MKINEGYLIKNNGDIWLIKVISSYEVHAIIVTDIYKLNEEYESTVRRVTGENRISFYR